MRSLRHRLVWSLVAALSLVGSLGGVATYVFTARELRHEFDRTLIRDLSHAVPQIAIHMYLRDRVAPLPDTDLGLLLGVRLQVFDERGDTVLQSDQLDGCSLPRLGFRLPVNRIADSILRHVAYRDVHLRNGRQARAAGIRVEIPAPHQLHFRPGQLGSRVLTVVLANTLESVDRPLRVLTGWIIAITLLTVSFAAWTARHLVIRTTRPLDELGSQISILQPDSLGRRIELPEAPVEIAPMRDQLNLLLSRLEEAFRKEQEFAANAAHELNTPLAALQATIEVALQDGVRDCHTPDCSAPDLARAMGFAHGLTLQMASIVHSLLSLVRSDSVELAPLGVEELIRRVIQDLDAEARVELCGLSRDLHGTLVLGDPELLRLALHNVLENAITYGMGTVHVSCEKTASDVTVVVRNRAEGLPEHLADRAFDTFWRGDPVRSDRHAGLGLSLCRGIILAQRGRITMRVADDQVTVLITLLAADFEVDPDSGSIVAG